MSDDTLWFIVNHENDGPVTFGVEGVVISPYLFSDYDEAILAVADEVWPKEVAKTLVVKPGPAERFLNAMLHGFPNTKPKPPDAIAFNSEPGNLFSGLLPLTPAGAALADRLGGTDFWGTLAAHPGALRQSAVETVRIALGLSVVN
jgi:hypothetical protein